VLRNTTQGNLRPPNLSYEVIGENFGEAFKQIGLFMIMGIAISLIFHQLGQEMGILSLFAAVLLLPAMIIVLATTDSLIAAINPVACMTIAYNIGWGYLLMYLFLALLLSAPAFLVGNLAPFLAPEMWQFLSNFTNNYYTIISYNLMGYVILQYHENIGHEVTAADFTDQAPVLEVQSFSARDGREATEAILNHIEILIKDGRAEDAVMLLRDRMRGRAPDRLLAERYYNLLKITQRIPELLKHSVSYLDLLSAENEKATACKVYKECLSHDPEFSPDPEALFKIAVWCMEDGGAKLGMNSLVQFIRTNPQHAMAPKAHFVLARNLHEKFHNPAKAEQVLQGLIQRYPDHDLAAHAGQYLERIRQSRTGS
jgi:tetratricopeptide (TPR) repeat protein